MRTIPPATRARRMKSLRTVLWKSGVIIAGVTRLPHHVGSSHLISESSMIAESRRWKKPLIDDTGAMRYFRTGCLAVMLVLAGCARERGVQLLFPGAPVILISIDTLRADHLPAWGYRGVATPAIDRLRRDAVLFADARAHVPLTLPSHVSLLTGELPPRNGVRNNIGFHFDASKHPTIPGILRRQGYATGAAVSAYVLRASTG